MVQALCDNGVIFVVKIRNVDMCCGHSLALQLPGLESVIQPLVQPQVVRPDPGKSSVSLALALPGQLMCLDDTPRVIEGESGTWPDSAVLNQVYYQPGVWRADMHCCVGRGVHCLCL
jgi:hypothetical protein